MKLSRFAKRIGGLLMAALLLVVVVTATSLWQAGARVRAEDYEHRMTFQASAWRAASDERELWPTRLRMVDDLVSRRLIDGLERGAVAALLGPADRTDKWRDWDLVYWLGPNRGYFRIDSEWLVIRFNHEGRVQEYLVVQD
jgi:hypothetical protein